LESTGKPPTGQLSKDERRFILFCKFVAVLVGVIAGLGVSFLGWLVAISEFENSVQPSTYLIRALIIAACGITAGILVGSFQLQRVAKYRSTLRETANVKISVMEKLED